MYCRDWNIDCQLGLSRAYHNHVSFLFIPSSIRHFEVARETGSSRLSKCIVGLFLGDEFFRHVKNASRKTVPQCTLTTSNSVSRATSNWWIVISFGSHEEWNAENPLHSTRYWTSKIEGKLQDNLADFTKKIERLVKSHVYGISRTSDSSWEFLRIKIGR